MFSFLPPFTPVNQAPVICPFWKSDKSPISETTCNHCTTLIYNLEQGCPNSVLEGQFPAEFGSNPNQTPEPDNPFLLGIL